MEKSEVPCCYNDFIAILKEELVPAMGCTEPIAIAFAAARAREILGRMPDKIEVNASGNIIKNVKGVVVPSTGGLKGVKAAALAGAAGGDSAKGLEVLSTVTPQSMEVAKAAMESGVCCCNLLETPAKLHIILHAGAGDDTCTVELMHQHTNIVKTEKNGQILFSKPCSPTEGDGALTPRGGLNIDAILDFAQNVELARVEDLIMRQIEYNSAISKAGLTQEYGANVGSTLLKARGDCIITRAKAAAAAGSDARMSGCELPVITNSGSGNQGMTVSLPVIEYAKEIGASKETLIRALLISNLMAIYQKSLIGRLSAFCGAVSASAGAGAGVAYLRGFSKEQIGEVVTSTLCNTGGIVCDGAKPSCAAKVCSAVDSALMACDLVECGNLFCPGEGLVKDDLSQTIEAVAEMARDGMKDTDVKILNIMVRD